MEKHLARTPIDDGLSEEQRKQFSGAEEQWVKTFQRLSDSFDENAKVDQPTSLKGLVELFEGEDDAILQAWGKMLYKRDDGVDGGAESIRQFYDLFPPFRAMLIAMLVQQWERCFRGRQNRAIFSCGP